MKRAFTLLMALAVLTANAQVVETSVSSVDFGEVVYGAPETISVEMTNLSSEEVQVEEVLFFDIYESSPFSVENLPSSIPANGSVSFDVVFDPVHNIDHNTEMIIKTSGDRGAISVDLKGAAEYPGDYYDDTQNEMDQDLKEALNDILDDGFFSLGYDNARDEMYMEVDNQQVNGQGSSQNRLTRAYLGTDAIGYTSRSDLFNNYDVNCEHTFPQGTFNSNSPMRSDMHHLFPTDVDANSTRGSLRFGNVVSNENWSQGGSKRGNNSSGEQVFEPRDGQKGKSARAILYFLVRYQNYGGHVSADMEETMREWHFSHAVDDVDMQRNDDIFDRQNNRNPFVDYPQMVNRIFSFRLEEDRPNIGELAVSHQAADFGVVTGSSADFNVVLANIGERFFSVSDVSVSGAGFSLSGGQDDGFVIQEGEAAGVRVNFDPSTAQGSASGTLTFSTNLSSSPTVSIPLSAEGVLGLTDLSDLGLALYPNPAGNFFQLVGRAGNVRGIQLLDIEGREVKAFANAAGSYSLGGVSNGIYLVKARLNDGTIGIQRLVVNR